MTMMSGTTITSVSAYLLLAIADSGLYQASLDTERVVSGTSLSFKINLRPMIFSPQILECKGVICLFGVSLRPHDTSSGSSVSRLTRSFPSQSDCFLRQVYLMRLYLVPPTEIFAFASVMFCTMNMMPFHQQASILLFIMRTKTDLGCQPQAPRQKYRDWSGFISSMHQE